MSPPPAHPWLVAATVAAVVAAVCAVAAAPVEAVVGGTPAAPGEAAWTVALVAGRADRVAAGHFCGGTLVRPDTVITAGHCVEFDDDNDLNLATPAAPARSARPRAGSADIVLGVFAGRVLPLRRGRIAPMDWIATYPGFDDGAGYTNGDIAVIRLRRPLRNIATLALPTPTDEASYPAGGPLTVYGWGNRSRRQGRINLPRELYRGDITRFPNTRCDALYGRYFNPASQLCAGRPDGATDACDGDSGGPLIATRPDGHPLLAGIVSYGEGCGDPEFPTVYTRAVHYATWLERTVNARRRPAGAVDVSFL